MESWLLSCRKVGDRETGLADNRSIYLSTLTGVLLGTREKSKYCSQFDKLNQGSYYSYILVSPEPEPFIRI